MTGGTWTPDPEAVSAAFIKRVGSTGFSKSPKLETGLSTPFSGL